MVRRPQTYSTLAVAAGLFVLITAWRFAEPAPATGITFLYVVPISLLAVELGYRGAISGAAAACGLVAWWGAAQGVVLRADGYLVRAVAFFAVALVVARQVQRRRAQEDEAQRWFSLADEMCCVADFRGYFTRVNGAWTRCLGYSPDELVGQPFTTFVHPEDRELTNADSSSLVA